MYKFPIYYKHSLLVICGIQYDMTHTNIEQDVCQDFVLKSYFDPLLQLEQVTDECSTRNVPVYRFQFHSTTFRDTSKADNEHLATESPQHTVCHNLHGTDFSLTIHCVAIVIDKENKWKLSPLTLQCFGQINVCKCGFQVMNNKNMFIGRGCFPQSVPCPTRKLRYFR